MDRDGRSRHNLLEAGWRVAVVWECALRKRGQVGTAANMEGWLRGDEATFETSRPMTDDESWHEERLSGGGSSNWLRIPVRPITLSGQGDHLSEGSESDGG